jgi:hypothetical protein
VPLAILGDFTIMQKYFWNFDLDSRCLKLPLMHNWIPIEVSIHRRLNYCANQISVPLAILGDFTLTQKCFWNFDLDSKFPKLPLKRCTKVQQ